MCTKGFKAIEINDRHFVEEKKEEKTPYISHFCVLWLWFVCLLNIKTKKNRTDNCLLFKSNKTLAPLDLVEWYIRIIFVWNVEIFNVFKNNILMAKSQYQMKEEENVHMEKWLNERASEQAFLKWRQFNGYLREKK